MSDFGGLLAQVRRLSRAGERTGDFFEQVHRETAARNVHRIGQLLAREPVLAKLADALGRPQDFTLGENGQRFAANIGRYDSPVDVVLAHLLTALATDMGNELETASAMTNGKEHA